MKRLMLYIASVMLIVSQACEKDPTFNFREKTEYIFRILRSLIGGEMRQTGSWIVLFIHLYRYRLKLSMIPFG